MKHAHACLHRSSNGFGTELETPSGERRPFPRLARLCYDPGTFRGRREFNNTILFANSAARSHGSCSGAASRGTNCAIFNTPRFQDGVGGAEPSGSVVWRRQLARGFEVRGILDMNTGCSLRQARTDCLALGRWARKPAFCFHMRSVWSVGRVGFHRRGVLVSPCVRRA